MAAQHVTAVLLNWNGHDDTRLCVQALRSGQRVPDSIVVVDNGSAPGSLQALQHLQHEPGQPAIDLVLLPANRGFAGGVNVGMQRAWALGASHAWLVNTDALPAPDCLAQLLLHADAQSQAQAGASALLSPVIHFEEAPQAVQHHLSFIDLRSGAVIECRDAAAAAAVPRVPTTPPLLWGTALLIPRAAAQAIGPFDEQLFAYGEDSDYCLRAHRLGIGAEVVPAARILHGNPVHGPRKPHYYYYTTRNVLRFNRRFFGWRLRSKLLWWHLGRLGKTWRDLHGLDAHRQALAVGLWHGLTGRGGVYDSAMTPPAVVPWLFNRVTSPRRLPTASG